MADKFVALNNKNGNPLSCFSSILQVARVINYDHCKDSYLCRPNTFRCSPSILNLKKQYLLA